MLRIALFISNLRRRNKIQSDWSKPTEGDMSRVKRLKFCDAVLAWIIDGFIVVGNNEAGVPRLRRKNPRVSQRVEATEEQSQK
jgi:hypothetical protein